MAQARGDDRTLDLFAVELPRIVPEYDEKQVRTASLRAKIARAVSVTLKECGMSRDEVASRMSAWLGEGEEVTKNMLDAYASEGREDHTIPYLRLLALVHVTGDSRPLGMGATLFGHIVVEDKYAQWVRVGMEAERRERAHKIAGDLDREFDLALRLVRRRSS